MENKKVLIVEDDVVLAKTLVEFMSGEGFSVSHGHDGEEGEQLAKKIIPDLILLDVILPKKDGYEVLEALKKEESTKNIPIVLLTNLGSLKDVEKALGLGATTYLVKGDYSLEDIANKAKEILKIQK